MYEKYEFLVDISKMQVKMHVFNENSAIKRKFDSLLEISYKSHNF